MSRRPFKICWLVHRIGPYHHARFKQLGSEVNLTVIEIRPDSQEYPWKTQPGEDCYQRILLLQSNSNSTGFHFGYAVWRMLANIFDDIRPQAVFTTGWSDIEYFMAWLWAWRSKIPIFSVCDSTLDNILRKKWKESVKSLWVCQFDGYLVAGSRSEQYVRQLNFRGPITKPWDTVDNEYFSKTVNDIRSKGKNHVFSHNGEYLLCVARFIREKNHTALLKAYQLYVKEHTAPIRLLLVGSGPLKDNILNTIAELELEKSVDVYDFAQYDILPQFYAFAKALILPSVSDTWGLVVNEAMAAGIPVLVSDACGCVDDLVIDNQTGRRFPPTEEGIRLVLNWLHEQLPTTLSVMGKQAARHIQAYSNVAFAAGVLHLIDNVERV